MKPTAAITGMHIRMDVPTKCRVVESILTQTFADKEALNAFINTQALKLDVNPVTIKLWCSKYADIFLIGKQLFLRRQRGDRLPGASLKLIAGKAQ